MSTYMWLGIEAEYWDIYYGWLKAGATKWQANFIATANRRNV